ncbi:hypothetical protein LINGRAHAP2_LOCUS27644 [Linum grandiflorum]
MERNHVPSRLSLIIDSPTTQLLLMVRSMLVRIARWSVVSSTSYSLDRISHIRSMFSVSMPMIPNLLKCKQLLGWLVILSQPLVKVFSLLPTAISSYMPCNIPTRFLGQTRNRGLNLSPPTGVAAGNDRCCGQKATDVALGNDRCDLPSNGYCGCLWPLSE